ncbi:MAG: transcription antitermination factor NusB [Acidobacteriia bacterium]|nr:transcription antitermination factor NusB [Terriglobia bacterium]
MPSRYKSRQSALQFLFLADMRAQSVEQAAREFYGSLASDECEPVDDEDRFALELATGAKAAQAEIDQLIVENSANWRLERMPVVDRNILRLAIYELRALPTPAAVVIDQALELGSRFSSEESLPFLNGVLDAVKQKIRGQSGNAPA